MKPVRRLAMLFALLLCLPCLGRAAGVRAALDRDHVQLGETVTLNLQVDGSGLLAVPDLTPLDRDFAVLGTSSNTSVSIVNGRRSATVTIGIALRPKRSGALEVPALDLAGSRTAPLRLAVAPASPAGGAAAGRPVFLEAEAQPARASVGQQLVYTVRLYVAASLASGALDDPQLPGTDVRRLGNDIDYDTEREGRHYRVIERRYALIPQHPGTLRIPPLAFQGELVDPGDPDTFFGMGSPVSAATPETSVAVQPIPPSWGKSAWLPARALALMLEGVPADGQVRAGQPLELVMTEQATGLAYEVLPALSLPTLDGATVYPDKPVTGTRLDGTWLVGRRQQAFTVVPDRPGRLSLPAITLQWWNVQTGRAETASLPARTLTVLPAAGATPPAPAASAS
ncbi:BatD family protein, partial [Frateuria defendens]|uniref:BatD family protein n=1 Tax=Frateuria defendens TaxID=2219559 RepID=UPI00066FF4B9